MPRSIAARCPTSRSTGGGWRRTLRQGAAGGIRESGAFAGPERLRFDWKQSYTREEWLEQVPTFGGYNRFPPAARAQLLDGIGAVVDAAGGRFTMRYAAVAVMARRR